MDKGILFTNGSVFVGGGFAPRGTSVLVTGNRIAAVGAAVDAGPARRSSTWTAARCCPGFIDAHAHPVFGGMQLLGCDLRGPTTRAGYLEIIDRYARANPDREWITGGGWSMTAFPGGIPTRQALDARGGRPPGRSCTTGTAMAPGRTAGPWSWPGSTGDTADPRDGRIERDDRGDPVGTLQEGAMQLVPRLLPPVTDEDRYRGLLAGQDYLLSLGVTGWQDAIVGRGFGQDDATSAYRAAASAGTLKANVVGALWWRRHEGLEQLEELLHRRASDGAGRFRPTSVKMMLDGVAENHTAALLDPYLDAHGCATENSGLDFIDPDELPRFVTELDARGFQVHFHALGDRAVRNALNAVEAARHANKDSAIRHHLAHLQVIHPDDIPRFAALGATANIQPLWATNEAQMTELTIPFLGETRAAWQYPFAALAAAGAHSRAAATGRSAAPIPCSGCTWR